jgi:hypothetical protein
LPFFLAQIASHKMAATAKAAIEWAVAASMVAGTALYYYTAVNMSFSQMNPATFKKVMKPGVSRLWW